MTASAVVRRRLQSIGRDERGEIEDAPALVLLIGGVLFTLTAALFVWGQYAAAETQVQAAAYAAARDVSLSRSSDTSQTVIARASTAARASLGGNVDCRGPGRHGRRQRPAWRPSGPPASSRATVTCGVRFHTIRLPGIPVGTTVTRTAASPTDPYRER